MKTLIVYASQYGTTEKCARLLAEALACGADLCSLQGGALPDLPAYDTVVVGTSVRAGMILKPAKKFAQSHADTLLQKRLGLYLCSGMPTGVPQYFEQNFPATLLAHAAARGAFGGEFLQDKMGFFARKMVRMAAGSQPTPHIDMEAIRAFAARMEAG